MGKKLITIPDGLMSRMKIAREQELMKGNRMSLDRFYERILETGLKDHYDIAVKTEKSGK